MSILEEKFTRSHVAEKLLWLDGKPFRLKDYPFFRDVYNIQVPEIVLKTGRQVAKSLMKSSTCTQRNGAPISIADVCVGQALISLAADDVSLVPAAVTWKSDLYKKYGIKITTRQGHELSGGPEHPVRVWDGWKKLQDIVVGDRVATVRQAGEFLKEDVAYPDTIVEFVAFMVGDGCCGISQNFSFTQAQETMAVDRFCKIIEAQSWDANIRSKENTQALTYNFSRKQAPGSPRAVLEEWDVYGCRSANKKIPKQVWSLSKRQTVLFLNRLWSTDGHVKKNTKSKYTIEYSSISRELIHGVQTILWKFGIPSKIWSYVPEVYEGTEKRAYKLRVETAGGVRTFLTDIGALGKSEGVPLPDTDENNNRDTLPKEARKLIRDICNSTPTVHGKTLFAHGLRRKPKYALTYAKLQEYVNHFRANDAYDQTLVDKLAVHLDTDLYWDKVVSVEPTGEIECYDITVETTGSFIANGIVTHNSTCCANLMLIDSIMVPHFRTLYISPSREQTSKFSNTRLSKIIHYSPLIRNTYVNPKLPNNVLLQILGNGSEMSLSYADDDPDRVRGITADRELVDEVQDILYDAVIPVVKECMANSDYGYIIYAGTPKSMENTIEYIWKKSTQSEWIMKCPGCGSWQFVDSTRSIGRIGIVCVKCDKPLNPRDGVWYDFNPDARVKGFHISQPILPKNNEVPMRWQRILEKLENYSETKFKNEVLGVSDAIGSRYISQEELMELCDSNYFIRLPLPPSAIQDVRAIVGGVDWGGGTGAEQVVSRTVAWVYGLTHEFKLKTLYFEIFKEDNPAANVERVASIFAECGCKMVVGDAGGGAIANAMLRDRLGEHRIAQCQYGGGVGFDKLIRWSRQSSRYLVNRTAAIDSYMMALKNHEVIFSNIRQMATPMQDILNEYEEMTTSGSTGGGRRVWRHAPSAPDDCLHAQIYAWLAMKIVQGDVAFYENREEDG